MPRDLEVEIDALRDEVRTLVTAVQTLTEGARPQPSSPREMTEETKAKCPRAYALRREYPEHEAFVSYFGFYETGESPDGQSYFWDINRSGDTLLAMDDDRVAKVLSALASKQRLAILKFVLSKPTTAADLVDKLNLGTTGQVYHHLKALQSADLIAQEERGLFCFRGHRVSGLLMLLSAVAGMLDERYSSGTWEEES